MPETVAGPMGQAFSADLSTVRVHHDQEATALATSLQARAFAYGNDLYFSAGAFQPGTASGRRLLAHEVAHVLQQSAAGGSGAPTIGRSDDPAEAAADAMADQALRASDPGRTDRGFVGEVPVNPDYRTLRRDIGFEFEIKDLGVTSLEHDGGPQTLKKGLSLLQNSEQWIAQHRFDIQVDEIGSEFDVEFVTPTPLSDKDGSVATSREKLDCAAREVMKIAEALKNWPDQKGPATSHHFRPGLSIAHHGNETVSGTLQMTVGLSLDELATVRRTGLLQEDEEDRGLGLRAGRPQAQSQLPLPYDQHVYTKADGEISSSARVFGLLSIIAQLPLKAHDRHRRLGSAASAKALEEKRTSIGTKSVLQQQLDTLQEESRQKEEAARDDDADEDTLRGLKRLAEAKACPLQDKLSGLPQAWREHRKTAQAVEYPKALLDLLYRTDIPAMLSLLAPDELAWLAHKTDGVSNLCSAVLTITGTKAQDPVLPPNVIIGHDGPLNYAITMGPWLTGLLNLDEEAVGRGETVYRSVDPLTKAKTSYILTVTAGTVRMDKTPSAAADSYSYEDAYLESIGAYGSKTDAARADGQPRRAIFEIRGIPRLTTRDLPATMLKIYDAVQALRERGASG
ncbi:DUF4157 domain-containing protein [Kineosporia sp. NBRC 101731]|uniref:eCIS core domain-containing protein n=1 Tax=Kineosporia sp. NBRC 101731 TaxID=3032199 RepID=UPI002554615C|nr:DUF4157 domain-containing protein [Kineosporia sp. NBRC 101731]